MNEFHNYLQILEEDLNKKLIILSKLISITDAQSQKLQAEVFDEDSFQEDVVRKGELIDELIRLDEGFQSLYDIIKVNIESQKEQYKDSIVILQSKIRMVIDQSMTLERKEHANEPLVSKRFSMLRKEASQVHKSREFAVNYYRSMNHITSEPTFMDEKK